jgi:hypothetical protein
MQFSMFCSSFLAGTIILRNGSSFEKFSIVRVVLLVMLLLDSLWLLRVVVGELDIAVLKAGTAKCDFSEIIFRYTHELNTTENSTDKNGN